MSKKTGIILMFIGAYIVLLGGLFWNMSLPNPTPDGFHAGNVYDWFWGVSAGIILAIAGALCIKKNFLCLIGLGVDALGLAYTIGIIVVGLTREAYFSIWLLIGAVISAVSIVITMINYFKEAEHIKKHGRILM